MGELKKAFIDLETSGLEPGKGVIFSAGVTLSTGEEETEVIFTPTREEFDNASPKALEVNGMTWDYLVENGVPFDQARKELLSWLVDVGVNRDNWVFMAQNAKFDRKFMEHFMKDLMYSFYGLPDTWVDFIPLYKHYGRKLELNVKYRNQTHIAEQLGVPPEPEVHEALEGARSLKRNYMALRQLAKKNGLEWRDQLHKKT